MRADHDDPALFHYCFFDRHEILYARHGDRAVGNSHFLEDLSGPAKAQAGELAPRTFPMGKEAGRFTLHLWLLSIIAPLVCGSCLGLILDVALRLIPATSQFWR